MLRFFWHQHVRELTNTREHKLEKSQNEHSQMHVLLLSTPMNTSLQRGSLLDLGLRFLPMMSTLTAHKFVAGAPNKSTILTLAN